MLSSATQLFRFGETDFVRFPVVRDTMRAEEDSAQSPRSVVVFQPVAVGIVFKELQVYRKSECTLAGVVCKTVLKTFFMKH